MKVGDPVQIHNHYTIPSGTQGKLVVISERWYGVDFGDIFQGHNLEGHLTNDTGYWLRSEFIESPKELFIQKFIEENL